MTATVKGIFSARRILKEFKPDVVIGVGGYASFPMVMRRDSGRISAMIMEQNAIPGLANRMLARWVDFAAITDPQTQSTFGDRAVVTGNPVRPQFKSISAKAHQPPFTVLVFGGSQGAQSINRADSRKPAVPRGLEDESAIRPSDRREAGWRKSARLMPSAGFDADVRAFFNDFHEQYAAADLIVSRAGATTVAEIKAAGRAAILIPFPTAADDHQTKNAQAMVEENAARHDPQRRTDRRAAGGHDPFDAVRSGEARTQSERNARRIAILDAEAAHCRSGRTCRREKRCACLRGSSTFTLSASAASA